MDPLSIATGTIAIGHQLTGLLLKIKPFIEAPRDVDRLIKDVALLNGLINELRDASGKILQLTNLPAREIQTLQNFVDAASQIILELEEIIGRDLKKLSQDNNDRLKVHRLTWLRKADEVEKLRRRLHDLHTSLTVQLGTLNILAILHSHQSLSHITLQAGQILSQNEHTQRHLLQQFQEYGKLLSQISERQQVVSEESRAIPAAPALVQSRTITFENLRRKIQRRYRCKQWCPCSCHRSYLIQSPPKWSKLTGTFQAQISGLPSNVAPCSLGTCKSRSELRIQLRLCFPQWVLGRILTVSTIFIRQVGPQFSLRVTRVRNHSDLIFANAQAGNIEAIRRQFEKGEASAHDVDEYYCSLLNYAVNFNQWELCKFLLDQGSDPHFQSNSENTAYTMAWEVILTPTLSEVPRDMLQELFPYDEDAFYARQMSPLQMMITGQTTGDIQMKIENSKDINYVDLQGMTALHWAIICGKLHIVRSLLSKGADPFREQLSGVTPIECAAKFHYQAIPLLVAAGCTPDLGPDLVGVPIHQAVSMVHQNPGQYITPLLDAGWSINEQGVKGGTPLWKACVRCERHKSIPTVDFLLQKGADVNLPDFENYTPLLIATEREASEHVDRLIQAGADCTVVTIHGRNILHCVARLGDIETMRVLIKWRERLKDLGLNRRCNGGFTPLDYAEKRQDVPEDWAGVFKELILAILEVQNAEDMVRVLIQEDEENEFDREIFEDALEVHDALGDSGF